MLRLAVTLGDPRGIGPEVMVEGVRRLQAEQGDTVSFVLLGGGSLAEDLPANAQFQSVGPFDGTEASAGMVSVEALREGVRLCLAGEADALVTGPVSKPALLAAGVDTPGQTEFLGDLTGAHDVGMLMASARARIGDQLPLRILLLTTHLPLREVSDALTEDRLERQLRLLNRALRAGWKIAQPRIALCALNPHASDGGRFGDEEARILEPVVERLRREGDMDVRGPFPADTVFLQALQGAVDAVAVPAHDVGMAVFKSVAFGTGVNTTLGLPFPRTSPDHGTAFDRAGTGTADAGSALAALHLAVQLAASAREGGG
jgi:4-hydroxythreonine-4-phosphate dehydrogenase